MWIMFITCIYAELYGEKIISMSKAFIVGKPLKHHFYHGTLKCSTETVEINHDSFNILITFMVKLIATMLQLARTIICTVCFSHSGECINVSCV